MSADPEYVVCDRLLDAETNEHCEFDGNVMLDERRRWRCPGCGRMTWGSEEDRQEDRVVRDHFERAAVTPGLGEGESK